jgi:hypothetical protein
MRMSSLNVLCYCFRANCDGSTSHHCPVDGLVTSEFEDLAIEESGSHESHQADLSIAADGPRRTFANFCNFILSTLKLAMWRGEVLCMKAKFTRKPRTPSS